jgi:hypothetical protein
VRRASLACICAAWQKTSLLGVDILTGFPTVQQFENGLIRVSCGHGFGTGSSDLSTHTAIGIEYVDIDVGTSDRRPVRVTFYWTGREQWERDFTVEVMH